MSWIELQLLISDRVLEDVSGYIFAMGCEGMNVKEDSVILKHLKVGDKLNLKYNPAVASDLPEYRTTEIRHIIKSDNGRFNGHYLVDFTVSEN